MSDRNAPKIKTLQSWKSTFNWLTFDINIGLQCNVCKKWKEKIISLKNFSDTFIKGSTNYRKLTIADHAKTAHLKSLELEEKETCILGLWLGCCDMVSKYDAVKPIRSKAVKELPMAISVGGVGNSMILPALGYFEHYGQSGKHWAQTLQNVVRETQQMIQLIISHQVRSYF